MNFLKKFKLSKVKNQQAGMTYIELITVLTIFAIMSAAVTFNYKDFQAKVDMKNIANDVALKIVQAQKSSVSGQLPPVATETDWKPSYGVFIAPTVSPKSFLYFADLDQGKTFTSPDPEQALVNGCSGAQSECLEVVRIVGKSYISGMTEVKVNGTETDISNNKAHITFSRPGSDANFFCITCTDATNSIRIHLGSSAGTDIIATIEVFATGRIQIN